MNGDSGTYDLEGVIMQATVFTFALVMLVIVELIELRKEKFRKQRLTDFAFTSRLSNASSNDDFLVTIRENIIQKTMV
jgi:hypothetical protein